MSGSYEILIKTLQFFLSLSILVVLHEFGHFFFAKIFKTRVEKFYMFFDPWFSLFKFKKGETEYGIGWVPLGGYVKIAGMIDESMDKEQMKKPAQPWEFRSKPAWQRLLIMIGGVSMNVLVAVAIYIGIFFTWGETYLPAENVKYGVVCDSMFSKMGVEKGDIIIALDGKKQERFNDIIPNLLLNSPKTMDVMRNGEIVTLNVPSSLVSDILELSSKGFKMAALISPRIPLKDGLIVDGFADYSPAYDAGMRQKDVLLSVNGHKLVFFDDLNSIISKYKEDTINACVRRGSDTLNLAFKLTSEGIMGVMYNGSGLGDEFDLKTVHYSFFESIPAGIKMGYNQIASYCSQLKLLFSHPNKAVKSVGGFISIGNIFPSTWDWQHFWSITALLSIILAVMNILPIPALDGGHVLFLIIELVTGRKPSEKVMEYAQIAGMILLFGLLILANFNDVVKLFN